MNEEMRALLKLLLAAEEETEAGQHIRTRKKAAPEPIKGIDFDPNEKKGRVVTKAPVSPEVLKKNREEDFEIARKELYENHEENSPRVAKEIPVWEKYALSINEAAEYFHIGRKKLREIIDKDKYARYLVWNGGRVFIKRKLFEEYLNNEVEL